jgi:hypothetical protein
MAMMENFKPLADQAINDIQKRRYMKDWEA